MSATSDLRLRQKQAPVGIAAGAEDAKYQAKYKELKRKVKDIEADNDKLHFKVLQAKLTIRRMKMERAILYERLTTVPPSPNLQDHPLPPIAVIQGGGPGGPPHPGHTHLRLLPGGGQSQHRDYPFHHSTNVDAEQQRVAGGLSAHIHPDNIRHHQHHHPSHGRSGGEPRINLTPGIDLRSASVDNQPAASSPRMPVHSPPSRISSTNEANIARQPHNTIPPNSVPYESRSGYTSPAVSSHHNTHGRSHSRKRSHSHSSPRTAHPHQIEVHQSGGHVHAAPPYRVLSSGSNNNNPDHGPGPGTLTQPLHQYPENLAPVQPSLHSPPLSEIDFERGGRAHNPHPHLHPQLAHQHSHSLTPSGGGHQHPHSQHPHHHHVVHHHHQHPHPHLAQAHTHAPNEYGGGLPGDPPTSSMSPAIQAHGAGYDSTGGRGTAIAGPPGSASASAVTAGSASGSGRTHAHPRERVAYDYPPTTQTHPEGKRERERDGGREREKDRDPDREWERERDRAREYSRGELINYSPPHHRTRSSQSQSQSRPLSRAHSHSHLASGGRSQTQPAVGHTKSSAEYEHSASNSSRNRSAPSAGVPAHLPGTHTPHAYHSSPEDPPQAQGYRDYPPPDLNTMYAPRLAPSSRAATPGVTSNVGSGSTIGPSSVAGPDASNNSGPCDRDRDREKDRGIQQPSIASPAAGADNGTSDYNQGPAALDSGRKRSRNEMEMEVDGEYQANHEVEGLRTGRPNGGGREVSLQPQDEARGGKRYHRQASPERERR